MAEEDTPPAPPPPPPPPDGEIEEGHGDGRLPLFRPFTVESLKRIRKRIEKAAAAAEEERKTKEGSGRPEETSSLPQGAATAVATATVAADAFAGVACPVGPSSEAPLPSVRKAPGAGAGAGAEGEPEEPHPDPQFEAGKSLPKKFGDFPPNLYGRPIEDLDEFYNTQYTFMIVARDRTIFRFSATNAFFILSPFNPVRAAPLFILTHPVFSLIVMVVILVNCVIMARNDDNKDIEIAFTIIYTCEGLVKMLARGFIMTPFTYLRDPWNWLDFIVVVLAYVTMGVELGNVAVLRTFRVLRALKTVAVVPGLKTIVGALMEAVRRLRDVMILSVFVLSIFALIGLQLYQGSLRRRCILNAGINLTEKETDEEKLFNSKEENWATVPDRDFVLCGEDAGICPENSTCRETLLNPDFNYTNFDNFPWAMLCAFRLMTQDFWESLYQQVIRTAGKGQMLFFVVVIFLGSFYLVNVILAIVAMSYDDCRKQDAQLAKDELEEMAALADQERGDEEDEEEEEEEEDDDDDEYTGKAARTAVDDSSRRKSISNRSFLDFYHSFGQRLKDRDEISLKSDNAISRRIHRTGTHSLQEHKKVSSISLPGSPFPGHHRLMTRHRSSQFSWKKPASRTTTTTTAAAAAAAAAEAANGDDDGVSWRPMVMPCLENLNLPYADDSTAVTPSSDDICSIPNTHLESNRRRIGSGGSRSQGSHAWRQADSFLQNQPSPSSGHEFYGHRIPAKITEPTHFHWNASTRHRKGKLSLESGTPDKKQDRSNCLLAWSLEKDKTFLDNPFICRTPSTTSIDLEDVLRAKELTKQAAGKTSKGFFGYQKGMNKKEFVKEKCMQLLFGWECTPTWYKIAHVIELFIMDAFVDLFITLCIVANTVFMAMEHYDMGKSMETILTNGNYIFTTIFTIEAGLKVLALGLYKYLQDKWSCFDFVIVILSLVELGLSNVKGLSILRSFRLLRVFKLAKSWPTLNLLISIIGRTMGALGNLCFVLAIIIFIFAVMGMQVFGNSYKKFDWPVQDLRWHFIDFLHSFMIVFRILCGEWIETMWGCIEAFGYSCIPFFLLTMIIGNLVVLNLFLALLLSSFGAETLKQSQEEEGQNKLQEAIDRINRFFIYIQSHLTYCFKSKFRRKVVANDRYGEEANFITSANSFATAGDNGGGALTVVHPPIGNGKFRATDARLRKHTEDSMARHGNGEEIPMAVGTRDVERDEGGLSPVGSEPSTVKINKESPNSNVSRLTRHSCNGVDDVRHSSDDDDRRLNGSSSSSSSSSSMPKHSLSSCHSMSSSSALSDFFFQDDSLSNAVKYEEDFEAGEGGGEGGGGNGVKVIFVKMPDECCPKCIMRFPLWSFFDQTFLGKIWWKIRCYSYVLVEHNFFETFIILMILASSLALAVEDRYIHHKPTTHNILKILDKVFTVIFVFEMAVKMAAYGMKKYFTDAWCWLDFIIVTISLIGWMGETSGQANMGAFRALRTLRALRPLRAVSRWEGMKVVVNALIQAIPAIFNVLLVCLVFWLIFSIMGVNLFMGRFGRCVDADNVKVLANITTLNITNKTVCEMAQQEGINVTWFHPRINFDNVLVGYLALFQVATFKGWMDIMYAAIDSTDIDQQHSREGKSMMYIYFVLFIVFGSFFTLNLFIGVIIENFNMQKKKAGGSLEMLMTEDQKKYYNAMKKLGSKQPSKPVPKPKMAFQLFFFKLTKNQKFDIAIMFVILLNMISMAIEYYDQSKDYEDALKFVNGVFIVIFTMECIMKLLGLRLYYFKEPWNVFDFVVVVVSVLTLTLSDLMSQWLPISPTLLRVVRVFRVGRVLRLVKSAKGIRTLLFSLAVSMPALFNIGLLLFLVMFIYSIVGMSLFMNVKRTAGLDEIFNFETFFNAMIVLFQTCTSAGWSDVLAALMNDKEPGCSLIENNCGNSALGIMYLVSYLVISFLVIVNMYIAVILENFSQATEDVQQGLTQDDFDMYYELWEKFDEKATQYIPLSQLSEFVASLEEPLQLPMPNLFHLVSMDITICRNDRVHCVDILDALTKHYLGTANDEAGQLGDLKGPEKHDYHPVSSTLKRQREIYVAKVIQSTWRNYVRRRQDARTGATHPTTEDATQETSTEEKAAGGEQTGREETNGRKASQILHL